MIRSCALDAMGRVVQEVSPTQIIAHLLGGEGALWADFQSPEPQEIALLTQVFKFHPLTIEDAVSRRYHHPKVDDLADHIFIITHEIDHDKFPHSLETEELALFLGRNYVVTVHWGASKSVDLVFEGCLRDGRSLSHGADFLAHRILDTVVDNYLPAVDLLEDRVRSLELAVLREPRRDVTPNVLEVQKQAFALKRMLTPETEVVRRLSRREFSVIQARTALYFRDVFDHLMRLSDFVQSIDDRADATLRLYLAALSNRVNDVVKVLSIVAAIFLPLNLVASIWGMTFVNLPLRDSPYGFAAIMGIMLVIMVVMLLVFRWRKWL